MDRERKNIGANLVCMAKQWFIPQSDGQVTLSKEAKRSPIERKQHVSKSNDGIFNESSPKLSKKFGNSQFELLPQRKLPSRSCSRNDDSEPFVININSSKSAECLQTYKTGQDSKWGDIPTFKIDKIHVSPEKEKGDGLCCPTCGQQWKRDTQTLETAIPLEQKLSKLDCQTTKSCDSSKSKTPSLPSQKKYQISGMKRSCSFGHKGRSQSQAQNTSRTSRVIKAASMMDDQIHSIHKQSKPKFGRTRSKESSKSTVSLTRCLSLNLDTLRIVRGDSSQDGSCLNFLKANKSSMKSGTSYENSIDCEDTAECSGTDYDDIINYSPKITKDTKYVNGCPLDEFKTIFDADSFRIPSIYGQLKIMFQFFNDTNELQVTILEASNVRVGNLGGNIGLYTKICLLPGKVQGKTGFNKHSTCNPVFYESFIFKMSLTLLLERQLKIKLYNKPGVFSIREPVGQCIVPLYNYDLTAVNVIWQNLQKCKGQKDEMDEFDFSFFERDKLPDRKVGKFLCGYNGSDD